MTVVVYVHGLWMGGQEGFLLRHRLGRALDAETRSFTYSSKRATIADTALALGDYLTMIRTDTLHLVAHSLGGLVVLQLFESHDSADRLRLPAGRIVLLGSPVRGSRSAERLARLPFGRALLGRAGQGLLGTRARRWDGPRELGTLAGDLSIGAGRLLGSLDAPNDGTVLVEETCLPGAADQLTLRVSHTGLPYAVSAAEQTAAFLNTGRFRR